MKAQGVFMSRFARRISRIHKVIGLVVGLQLLFWTVSGFYFTLYPIETIRGGDYRPQIEHGSLQDMSVRITAEEAARAVPGVWLSAELKPFLERPVWLITTSEHTMMIDAQSGARWSPLDPVSFRALQRRFETEEGAVNIPGSQARVSFLTESAPREYGGALPAWVIEDETTNVRLYFDATTGDMRSVRTNEWRLFDILWRFHIMDITGEDRFDTWWMKLVSFLAFSLVLTGFVLLIDRARKGRLLG